MTLKSRLVLRCAFMPVVSGTFLFLPAGSFKFWQGWVYLMIALAFVFSAFAYLYRHDPQLIERRLRRGWRQETVREQKFIMKCMFEPNRCKLPRKITRPNHGNIRILFGTSFICLTCNSKLCVASRRHIEYTQQPRSATHQTRHALALTMGCPGLQ